MCRLCVQANTQGMARSAPMPVARRARAGRDPMCMRSITSSGVAARKYSKNSALPNTSSRYAARLCAAMVCMAETQGTPRGDPPLPAVARATDAKVRSSVRMAIGRRP